MKAQIFCNMYSQLQPDDKMLERLYSRLEKEKGFDYRPICAAAAAVVVAAAAAGIISDQRSDIDRIEADVSTATQAATAENYITNEEGTDERDSGAGLTMPETDSSPQTTVCTTQPAITAAVTQPQTAAEAALPAVTAQTYTQATESEIIFPAAEITEETVSAAQTAPVTVYDDDDVLIYEDQKDYEEVDEVAAEEEPSKPWIVGDISLGGFMAEYMRYASPEDTVTAGIETTDNSFGIALSVYHNVAIPMNTLLNELHSADDVICSGITDYPEESISVCWYTDEFEQNGRIRFTVYSEHGISASVSHLNGSLFFEFDSSQMYRAIYNEAYSRLEHNDPVMPIEAGIDSVDEEDASPDLQEDFTPASPPLE